MSSTLSAHSPKFQSALVNRDALYDLPAPVALGRNHKPVPHHVLVDGLRHEVEMRGYIVKREQLAFGAKGAALFGVMDLVPQTEALATRGDRGMSLGFRNSTDQSMAIRGVAGQRVFVCDNLSMSGETFAIQRKNITSLDLYDAIARGFDKFLQHVESLNIEIDTLNAQAVSDIAAKVMIFDIFTAGVVPVRLFDDVERFYFHPKDDQTDCQPRTMWGVANAFTRAMQDLTPVRMFGASIALSRVLHGMLTRGNVVEGQVVR